MNFPAPPKQYRIADMSITLWDRNEDNQIVILRIDDNGGGHFPVLDLGSSYGHREGHENHPGIASFDADGLTALAAWAKRLCAWADAQEKAP